MPQHSPEDFDERRSRAKSVHPDTVASNPGNIHVQWSHFLRVFPQPARSIALGMIVLLSATLRFHWLWALPLLGLVSLSFLAVRRINEHFSLGDTLPGVIVSQEPPLVAVLTNLTTGFGQFNTLKVVEQPLRECKLGAAPIGTRVATVALYEGTGENGHWNDFDPLLVEAATRDLLAHRRALDSFTEDDWRELEEALSTLPSPPPPGLHPIGWNLPAAVVEQNRSYRREDRHFMVDVAPIEPSFRVYSRGEGTPRILCVEWPNPKKEEKRPDPDWAEAVHALARRKLSHEALLLDFTKWLEAPVEWVMWWKLQVGRTDVPIVLVLPEAARDQLDSINVQFKRDAALDWMEARLEDRKV